MLLKGYLEIQMFHQIKLQICSGLPMNIIFAIFSRENVEQHPEGFEDNPAENIKKQQDTK